MMGTVRIIQPLHPQDLARDAAIGVLTLPFRAAVLFPTQRAPRSRSHKPHSLYPTDRSDGPSDPSNTNSCVSTVHGACFFCVSARISNLKITTKVAQNNVHGLLRLSHHKLGGHHMSTSKLTLITITTLIATSGIVGIASAKTLPTPHTITAKAGETLHIPCTVNATAVQKAGYHLGSPDGAMVGFLQTRKGWVNAIQGELQYKTASVPVYGFGPAFANSTKQSGENVHGDKGAFVFKMPSDMKPGTYTLALYYVDGIDRHAETDWNVKVTGSKANISSTTSLTLTANPTTRSVGSATTLTVTVPTNPNIGTVNTGDYIVIADNGGMWSTTPKSDSSWLFTPSNEKVGNSTMIPANMWTMPQPKNQQGYYSLSDVMSLNGMANGTVDSIAP
jgi:hypothetical protein